MRSWIQHVMASIAAHANRRRGAGQLALVADGAISTVELSRQVLAAMEGVEEICMVIGPDSYGKLSAARIPIESDHVLVRSGEVRTYAFVQRLVALRLPYAYIIDDNFWMLLDQEQPLHALYMHPLVRRSLEYAISHAHVVLCHSEHFRTFLLPFNPNVVVVPTMFDFSVLPEDVVIEAEGELRVGVVGNVSRDADLALLVPVVQRVLQARPQVVFEFFGYTPPALQDVPGVRSLPRIGNYADYIRAKLSRDWLLGLAPLVANRFAEYKTNNKLREYGACSLAAIYSDAKVYRECVQEGVTGWVVPNETEAWVRSIIQAVDDPVRTRQVGVRARQYVESHHHLDQVAVRWKEALSSTFSHRVASLATIEENRRRVKKWERGPVDWPQIVSSSGAAKANAPGEAEGFFQRDVLLMLQPGEGASCEPLAPLAGRYCWAMLISTFRAVLSGRLVVEVWADSSCIGVDMHDLARLDDGATVRAWCDVPPSRNVSLVVRNESSGAVCLHGLSAVSSTTFLANGSTYPMGFAA